VLVEEVVRISRVVTFFKTGAPILTLRATCALALLLPKCTWNRSYLQGKWDREGGERLAMEWRTDWEGLGQKLRLGELQQCGSVHPAYDASLGALGMRKYGLARLRSFVLVDVHLRWVWMDRGSMKIAKDRAALVRMNISALMNCCSVDYVAPQGSLLVSCSLDDADTSLSLQRQKAMDLISTIRQVCEHGRCFNVCPSSWVVSSIVCRLVSRAHTQSCAPPPGC
jgi:hypothetical protein